MATYAELYDLAQSSALKNKIAVAIVIAADTIRLEDVGVTNHANRLIWAKDAFLNPVKYVDSMLNAALATNKALTVTAIQNATDAGLQTAIDAVVDIFATGS